MYAAFALLAMSAALASSEPALQPFTATYAVEWRGISAGQSVLELKKTGEDTYTYSSSNQARGLFRLAFPDAITQVSKLRIKDGQVQPLSYEVDDGSKSTERDVRLQFNWDTKRVTGTAENRPVDVELISGVQDGLSVQIALARELIAGNSPESFLLIDEDEIKKYRYTREGTETLNTPLGKIETVIYSSQRDGSNRVTRTWLAPSLGYLPVRAVRKRGDKVDFTLNIRSVQRESKP